MSPRIGLAELLTATGGGMIGNPGGNIVGCVVASAGDFVTGVLPPRSPDARSLSSNAEASGIGGAGISEEATAGGG